MLPEPSGQDPILVVDDVPQNRKLLRAILSGAGYRVIEADSGPQALERLQTEHPQAMILDIRMPGMTGYAVCEAIRRNPRTAALPVIMVTALSQPEDRVRGIQAGATDFIIKPFDKDELLARLRTSLALVNAGRSGITELLPQATVIADPAWILRAASPLAARWLGLTPGAITGQPLPEVLQRRGVSLPLHEWEATEIFMLRRADDQSPLAVKHTPVTDALGELILHVLVLCQGRPALPSDRFVP